MTRETLGFSRIFFSRLSVAGAARFGFLRVAQRAAESAWLWVGDAAIQQEKGDSIRAAAAITGEIEADFNARAGRDRDVVNRRTDAVAIVVGQAQPTVAARVGVAAGENGLVRRRVAAQNPAGRGTILESFRDESLRLRTASLRKHRQ